LAHTYQPRNDYLLREEEAKMKKSILMLLLAMMLTVVVGCQANDQTEEVQAEEVQVAEKASEVTDQAEPANQEAAHYPVTIPTYNRDQEVIEITAEKAPERVVVVYQNAIEIMLALGLEDKIVAAAGLDHEVKPEFKDAFDKVNYYESGISKEEVMGLNPDMIISWYSFFGEKKLGDVDFWHDRGVNTYMMLNSGCQPKKTVAMEYEDIRLIGRLFDVEDKAEALIADIQTEVAMGQAFAAERDPVKAVVLEIKKDGTYRIYGEDSVGGDMATQVGAELVAKESGTIGAEDLVKLNPDVIYSVFYSYYAGGVEYEDAINKLVDHEGLQSISAVQNARVLPMKLGEVYCSGVRTMDGVETMLKGLYPDAYQE
jgi:iron complex transport system substrate-binding protein